MTTRRPLAATVLAASAILALVMPASARDADGGSSYGDSCLNDAVKNPRFIEPYADRDPSRYRASHPREGYDDRQAAAQSRSGYRGRVTVRPYNPYGY